MEILKKVKRLVSESVKRLHTEPDAAPILQEFEWKIQTLKNSLSKEHHEALEDYARKMWLLYDGFMTSVENEDQRIQEVVSQCQEN